MELGECILDCIGGSKACDESCVDGFRTQQESCPCQVRQYSVLSFLLNFLQQLKENLIIYMTTNIILKEDCQSGCPCDNFECVPDKKSILVLNTWSQDGPVLIKNDGGEEAVSLKVITEPKFLIHKQTFGQTEQAILFAPLGKFSLCSVLSLTHTKLKKGMS